MDLTTLFSYAAAHAAVTAAPGPVTAVVLSRTMTHDLVGAIGFSAGVCVGKIVAILTIAAGVGLWAQESPHWIRFFRMAGSAYILFLAMRMWQALPQDLSSRQHRRGWIESASAGTAFSVGSPYTFVFYLLFLPSVAPTGYANLNALAAVLAITVIVVGGVLAAVILTTHRFKRLLSSPESATTFNRSMAVLLFAASAYLFTT